MMLGWGQLMATWGGILMPEATSWMHEAHCVKLTSVKSAIGKPGPGCTSGDGGGMAIRELALKARFSVSLRTEVPNEASKRQMYHLAPEVVARAKGNSVHIGSASDPSLMYSNLQQEKGQIRNTEFSFESNQTN